MTLPRFFPGKRRRFAATGIFIAIAVLTGCHRRPTVARAPVPSPAPSRTPPRTPSRTPAPVPGSWTERGLASWYGVPFHGRRAADGEIYNMYKMVAAHRTLPFNSRVRVTDLQNGRQVVVRIIDRGPFVKNRIIDLSFAAARALDMVGPGVVPVRLELLSGTNPNGGEFSVQVGAFSVLANAQRLRKRLGSGWGPIFIQQYDSAHGRLYRVRVGEVQSEAAAKQLADRLRQRERFPETFIVRLDK